ncbi:hypothetical protein C8T65DRAFT_700151 [Cerioporus squamosus]|nr:hypothetical protein C8T65DRAFT_700151 [Cerioporus squamosus]
MCPQIYSTHRSEGARTARPDLRISGAAGRAEADALLTERRSDSDVDAEMPPPLEPALPVSGRAPDIGPNSFAVYRAQGTSSFAGLVDLRTPASEGRRSRRSRWSSSSSDEDTPPPLRPAPNHTFPWGRPAVGTVTSVEQYLVIVVDGERMFFRVSIRIERVGEVFRPSVDVEFMNRTPGDRSFVSDVWVLFATQMESILLREVDHASGSSDQSDRSYEVDQSWRQSAEGAGRE